MRGLPKRFGTGDDIRNCFSLVKEGVLSSSDLLTAVINLEAQNYAKCPILKTNNKTITLVYCPEIVSGSIVHVSDEEFEVIEVNHSYSEDNQPERTILLFSETPPESDSVVRTLTPTIYDKLDISKEELDSIKEALK